MNFILVFLGAGIGGVLRYCANLAGQSLLSGGLPWATVVVNVMGSLLIGILAGALPMTPGNEATRLFLATGVLGGFTTFSAFSIEAVALFERHHYALAAAYVTGSIVLAIGAAALGYALAR